MLLVSATLLLAGATSVYAKEQPRYKFQPPQPDEILHTLKANHPRLLISPERVKEIKLLISEDKIAACIHASVLAKAERALKEKPAHYELRDGRRLLYVSREVLERVDSLAYAFLMTGRQEYVQRVWAEVEAVSKFKDWNPAHFLDVAEMTHAFAIAYDWLWDEWTPEQRLVIRNAIVKMGLSPAMAVYVRDHGWHKNSNNWNQVCNGGIGMGALAIAGEEPELAGKILSFVLASIPLPMRAYAPDGAGMEGVGYWEFGSRYNILLLASLESALGRDFGLSRIEGFRQSGDYQIYLSGTDKRGFDFSDSSLRTVSTAQHFWMGKHYNIPRYKWFRYNVLQQNGGGDIYDLLWFDNSVRIATNIDMPLDRHFRRAECASMRDTWNNGHGFIVALQGGANRGSHRHLDLGSFILEMDGVRWIIDSGKDGATYQRHKSKASRWDFYRTRAEGHNTLVFNPDGELDQSLGAVTRFNAFTSKPDRATTEINLTSAYKKDASKVMRSFELLRDKAFTVTDHIICPKPAALWSYFHTNAEVTLSDDKRSGTLRQGDKTLRVKLLSPARALLTVMPAAPGPKSPKPTQQASNKGRCKLAVHLEAVRDTVITVRFER